MHWTKGKKITGMLIGVVLITALLRSCVATSYLIPSSGMENSLLRGERILVNKWSYGLRIPFMHWIGYHRWCEQAVHKNDIIVFNNPANYQEPVIDQREIFINRCIGTPGDTLLIDSLFSVTSSEQYAPDQKFLYAYPLEQEQRMDSILKSLSICSGQPISRDSLHIVRNFSRYEQYLISQALNNPDWFIQLGPNNSSLQLKPLIIPGKNSCIKVEPWNITLLCNTLTIHEKKQATIQNDTLFLEGKPVTHCTFNQDYYWVVSNNPANISDSRLFGLVPHSHIIGKAALIWLSDKKNRIGKTIQ
ncbi:signal peptidase I [gut metagenome]|uniref:Signal peptidase I n=1 Tax=gut metagenome TaxID=749906 RepID=J9FM39_9ZZZZ